MSRWSPPQIRQPSGPRQQPEGGSGGTLVTTTALPATLRAGSASSSGTQDGAGSVNPDATCFLVLGAQTVIAALTANAKSIPVYCDVFVPERAHAEQR